MFTLRLSVSVSVRTFDPFHGFTSVILSSLKIKLLKHLMSFVQLNILRRSIIIPSVDCRFNPVNTWSPLITCIC